MPDSWIFRFDLLRSYIEFWGRIFIIDGVNTFVIPETEDNKIVDQKEGCMTNAANSPSSCQHSSESISPYPLALAPSSSLALHILQAGVANANISRDQSWLVTSRQQLSGAIPKLSIGVAFCRRLNRSYPRCCGSYRSFRGK